MGKWEYEFDFCQLFGNTVQRAFTQMYSIVCRVVLSHAPSATEFIQLQFLENAKDAAAAAATATTMNLHGFSLHAQFIFMLNSAFMALHSIKFDFYSCTIKRIQTTNGRQRDGGEARRKSSKCTFFVSDSARCSFGLLVQSSFYLVSLDVCLFDGLVPQPTHIHTRHTHAGFSVFYLFMTRQNVTCDATRYYAMQVHCLCAQEKRWMDGGVGWSRSQLPVPIEQWLTQQQHAQKINSGMCVQISFRCAVFCQWHGKRFRSLHSVSDEWSCSNNKWEMENSFNAFSCDLVGISPANRK